MTPERVGGRVLFVDDEPKVLSGIRRMLRSRLRDCELTLVENGRDAIDLLESTRYDVLVTDMRMPEMTGTEVLEEALRISPRTCRIVLSGYSDLEATIRSSELAHQFLEKPCSPTVLESTIRRMLRLQRLLGNEGLLVMAGRIRALPTLSCHHAAIAEALDDPRIDVGTLAQMVELDFGLSAKILQMAHSCFFGRSQPVGSLREAISVMGLDVLRHMLVRAPILEENQDHGGMSTTDLLVEREHAAVVARVAQRLAPPELAKASYVAGLLHDIGKLVFADGSPELFRTIESEAAISDRSFYEVEPRHSDVGHGEIGAFLLGLWGLPHDIVEAVSGHHHFDTQRENATAPFEDVSNVVRVADALVTEVQFPDHAEEIEGLLGKTYDLEPLRTLVHDELRAGVTRE